MEYNTFMEFTGTYIPPTLTVDSIVFRLDPQTGTKLEVLLIERKNDPFKGLLAIPGGYNAAGETTHEAHDRILLKKGGLHAKDLNYTEQLYTFDTVARDPRGHAVSVAYLSLARQANPKESTTTQQPRFVEVAELPTISFDHGDIISYAHNRLKSKIAYTNVVFALIPEEFTLTQLQHAYEAIFGRELDKRNFRKKFLALDLIAETDKFHLSGAHRPAKLYRFKKQSLQTLERSFD